MVEEQRLALRQRALDLGVSSSELEILSAKAGVPSSELDIPRTYAGVLGVWGRTQLDREGG